MASNCAPLFGHKVWQGVMATWDMTPNIGQNNCLKITTEFEQCVLKLPVMY